MKKIIVSDKAFELLERIQFCMSLPYGKDKSISDSLVIFCSEVNRCVPKDSLLRTDVLVDDWKDYR